MKPPVMKSTLLVSGQISGLSLARRVGIVLLLVLVCCPLGGAGAATEPPKSTPLHFASSGRTINVDYFPPAKEVHKPAILVLHGAGGMVFDGPDMRRIAHCVAAADYPVYLVHYFNRTGSLVAIDSTMRPHFDEWLLTVRDAISWVRTQPPDGGRPVGIYGYSLGAFLTLAACSENHEVGAVVEQAGGIWYGQRERLWKLPPVLMVHGRDDQRVPFAKFALPLAALLKERGVAVETSFYPGEGHRFTQSAEQRVRDQTVEYFDRRLHP